MTMRYLGFGFIEVESTVAILSTVFAAIAVFAGLWIDSRVDKRLAERLNPIESKIEKVNDKVDEVLLHEKGN